MNRHVGPRPEQSSSIPVDLGRLDALVRVTVPEAASAESPRLAMHPLRYGLNNELHARPFAALQPPERISHLALRRDEQSAAEDHAFIVKVCEQGTDRTCSAAYQYFGIIFRHLAERRMSNRRRSNKFLRTHVTNISSLTFLYMLDLICQIESGSRFELIIHNQGIFLYEQAHFDHGRHPHRGWRRIGLCGRRATGVSSGQQAGGASFRARANCI